MSLYVYLALGVLLGALGYQYTERWDWGDSLWMVLITITTIGLPSVRSLSIFRGPWTYFTCAPLNLAT